MTVIVIVFFLLQLFFLLDKQKVLSWEEGNVNGGYWQEKAGESYCFCFCFVIVIVIVIVFLLFNFSLFSTNKKYFLVRRGM